MSMLDSHSLHLPFARMISLTDDEIERVSMNASHNCPNCDGDITIGSDEACGICDACYWNAVGDSK